MVVPYMEKASILVMAEDLAEVEGDAKRRKLNLKDNLLIAEENLNIVRKNVLEQNEQATNENVKELLAAVLKFTSTAASDVKHALSLLDMHHHDRLFYNPLEILVPCKVHTLYVTMTDGSVITQEFKIIGSVAVNLRQMSKLKNQAQIHNPKYQVTVDSKAIIPSQDIVHFTKLTANSRKNDHIATLGAFGDARFELRQGVVESAYIQALYGTRVHYMGTKHTNQLHLRYFTRVEGGVLKNMKVAASNTLLKYYFKCNGLSSHLSSDLCFLFFLSNGEQHKVCVRVRFSDDTQTDLPLQIDVRDSSNELVEVVFRDTRPQKARVGKHGKQKLDILHFITINNLHGVNLGSLFGRNLQFRCASSESHTKADPQEPGFARVLLLKEGVAEHFEVDIPKNSPKVITIHNIVLHETDTGDTCKDKHTI